MKKLTHISGWMLICVLQLTGQKVGIGTAVPVALLDLAGAGGDPTIPGTTSSGILRIASSEFEAVDIGKMSGSPYAAWIQSGFNGSFPDPLSLQPNGGNVGIGTIFPVNTLTVEGQSNFTGNLGVNTITPLEKLDVNGKIKIGNDVTSSSAGTIRWNIETSDFEGFNGTEWLSLTESNNNQWPGEQGGIGQISDFMQMTSNDGEQGDKFGISVAISGDYAVVGAFSDDIGVNTSQGSAYIFIKSGNSWTQQAKLVAGDGAADDRFGTSVAISGDYVIVGAPVDDIGANADQGSAYIFVRSGVSWTEQAKIVAADGASNDWFGVDVALEGDYAIVGAYTDDISANSNQGSAHIFLRSGSIWTLQLKLLASDGMAEDNFGLSVSISGQYAIVGAYDDHVGINLSQGSAYIFYRTGITWTQQAKIIASDGEADDYFGQAVSIYGDYVVVGAYGDDYPPDNDRGSAYVFARAGTTWTQQAKLAASTGSNFEHYGGSVYIFEEIIIIGASGDESFPGCSDPVRIGIGYIYKKQNNIWTLYSTIEDPLGDDGEQFGYSVSLYGDSFLAGGPSANPNGIFTQGKVVFGKID